MTDAEALLRQPYWLVSRREAVLWPKGQGSRLVLAARRRGGFFGRGGRVLALSQEEGSWMGTQVRAYEDFSRGCARDLPRNAFRNGQETRARQGGGRGH